MWLTALVGCVPDDWNGQPYTGPGGATGDTGAGGSADSALVGAWLSQGEDLSPLFSAPPFEYERVEGEFLSDGSYSFTTVTLAGDSATVTGSWSADTSTEPRSIALEQDQPYKATASGVYALDGDKLTYEVVQTEPNYGFSPPTPQGGFGSTAGPGVGPGDNVQIFRKVQ